MKKRFVYGMVLSGLLTASAAFGQEQVWVQIEAQPTRAEAEERLAAYAARLPDVNGFALGTGWYGIALGPYSPEDAQVVLRRYRAEGVIPRDSYVALPSTYETRFFPDQGPVAEAPAQTAPVEEAPQREASETRAEALQSERLLSRQEREELQIALRWAGVYASGIDGAFGRGTRDAMAAWQTQQNFEPTGVLTTAQRAELLSQYNAVLEGLDLTLVSNTDAGIEMKIPLGVVAFDRLEAPFAHYTPTGDLPARVLLISKLGGSDALQGLYDILQTLEIVPLEGPRENGRGRFSIEGSNDRIVTHVEAAIEGRSIKGFALVWPVGDEARRTRLLQDMQASYRAIGGVLPSDAGLEAEQRIDLLSGLQIRQAKRAGSGFYIGRDGTVLTAAQVVESCTRITLDEEYEATVVATDPARGLAVLRPTEAITPPGAAVFRDGTPRLRDEVAVAGYSYGGLLGAPTLTYGELADLRGLQGEDGLNRLRLAALDGDVGGPVFDAGGAVLGMLLPRAGGDQRLPEDVSFAADGPAIRALLAEAGISYEATQGLPGMTPEDLVDHAADMTVLVSCWE
ncbi:Putative peptidoglycan binding domain-containing protein [Poseidonocella pacifica]|uniref:Putative peptidoglycan binding domain-containing protein n=1 Tax=Poseidonocella pacifica TaxID=871651 RepID=A0A1I0V939_9RHOB|nr:serine protease [Poseidonocella pacifica]SFA72788.1 Putative peptidoglycan binding domain-containing protein [Poseidonocella pacifica]